MSGQSSTLLTCKQAGKRTVNPIGGKKRRFDFRHARGGYQQFSSSLISFAETLELAAQEKM